MGNIVPNAIPNTLRERVQADMQLAALGPATQKQYLCAINTFIRHTWLAPEAVDEDTLADYLRHLAASGVAEGTFKIARFGLQFLFQNTLGRDWQLFKKSCAIPGRSASRRPTRTKRSAR
jgi:hypothetical protein